MRCFLIRTSADVSDEIKDGKRRKTVGRLGKWEMLAGKLEGYTHDFEKRKSRWQDKVEILVNHK